MNKTNLNGSKKNYCVLLNGQEKMILVIKEGERNGWRVLFRDDDQMWSFFYIFLIIIFYLFFQRRFL